MTDDPYRTPARDALGAVVRVYAVPRRPRYLGSARAVQHKHYGLGAMNLPSAAAPTLSWLREPRADAVEVCEHGLRVRTKSGVLELRWDQIASWTADRVDGVVVAINLVGSHGEQLRLGGVLRDKDLLFADVLARRTR